MATVRVYLALLLIPLLWAGTARAEDPQAAPGLYDRPVLVVDPGMHTAMIWRASADRDGRWAVTGSHDKTVRVWSLADGRLERIIRLPAGPGYVGEVRAVAMSPDGALIAVGGWTRWTEADRQDQIYLFNRANGELVRRIEGLPNITKHLVFSPDGSRLAALLHAGGLRVYAKERGWDEVARDQDYQDQSYGPDFAPDGRLATLSIDGKVRLYGPRLAGTARPAVTVEAPGRKQPYGIAFSPPDGARLAVGYNDTRAVDVLDGHTLARLFSPDTSGVEDKVLPVVTWSRDGGMLLAGGGTGRPSVLGWSSTGAGTRRLLVNRADRVMGLIALPGNDLLVTDASPALARLGPDSTLRWPHDMPVAEFRNQSDRLAVSAEGTRVRFGYEQWGRSPARFDMATRTLLIAPGEDSGMTVPTQTGLQIEHWFNEYHPTLDGTALSLEAFEMSRSLAIHPSSYFLAQNSCFWPKAGV